MIRCSSKPSEDNNQTSSKINNEEQVQEEFVDEEIESTNEGYIRKNFKKEDYSSDEPLQYYIDLNKDVMRSITQERYFFAATPEGEDQPKLYLNDGEPLEVKDEEISFSKAQKDEVVKLYEEMLIAVSNEITYVLDHKADMNESYWNDLLTKEEYKEQEEKAKRFLEGFKNLELDETDKSSVRANLIYLMRQENLEQNFRPDYYLISAIRPSYYFRQAP